MWPRSFLGDYRHARDRNVAFINGRAIGVIPYPEDLSALSIY